MTYRIVLQKEAFKFSVAHFTILGPQRAERLHGHNYYVSVELGLRSVDPELGMAFDFNEVKPLVKALAERLDEYTLLPALSPFLKIERAESRVRAEFGKKCYEFPEEDVLLLPVTNISSEELSRLFGEELAKGLKDKPEAMRKISSLAVSVQETSGQTVFFEVDLDR